MALNNLRQLQQYRNTLVLGVILLGIGIVAAIIYFDNPQPAETPLSPKPQLVIKDNPTELQVDWSKVKLGMSQESIEKLIGKPSAVNENNGAKFIVYVANPKTPLATHVITLKNNKAVAIKRNVDSHNQIITREQYERKFGNAEVIREQSGNEVEALYAYKIADNEYLLIEVDTQNNQVYNILDVVGEEYENIKKEEKLAKEQSQPEERGFEAF